MKKLLSLTLCAILLLCSCNSNTTAATVQTSQTEEKTLSAHETTTETTTITTTVTKNAESSATTSSITSDTEESADSAYVSDVSDDDNEHDYEEYLASIDRTNEADVMSDEVLHSLVSETHKKAQEINCIFRQGIFSPSLSDQEVEPYCDENGKIYNAILTDKCHSMNDLWSYIGSVYVEDVVDELKNDVEMWKNHDENRFVEANGYIYLLQSAGKGSSCSYPETVEIVSLEESKITYSVHVSIYGEEQESVQIHTISKYDNGWKYDKLIY